MIYGDPQTYSDVPAPLLGITPDPLAMAQANNLYNYTINNPINHVDLNGEDALTLKKIGGGIATIPVPGARIVGGLVFIGGLIWAGSNSRSNTMESTLDLPRLNQPPIGDHLAPVH